MIALALLPSLEILTLRFTEVNDEGLFTLSKGCPTLKSLDLGDSKEVTDLGVWALCERLTQLETVTLSECEQVTEASIDALASLPWLRFLKFDNGDNLTQDDVEFEVPAPASLECLHLDWMNLTDDLSFFVAGCSRLKELSVTGEPKLTDKFLKNLASTTT
eukprot:TRINITY_DN3708_c0_g1_i1.p1 TRINITY_DN3708_c0_g1~~TRINITY_DN3708_c0_g1_i1.p1  ORF type:complete len:161 (+),score=17.85 TRINITY_DN3708_c0_g1_i1:194-676(+)